MQLLVGLGNPGSKYEHTRHNIGFMAVEAIASSYRFPAFSKKFKSLYAQGQLGGDACGLMMPQTYMNLSGESVGEAMRFFKLAPADIIVLHDEVDIPPGEVRLKRGGGTGGHNGLKSIEEHIGAEFLRIRIGVGRPQGQMDTADHVLADFSAQETDAKERAVDYITRNIEGLIALYAQEHFANKTVLKAEQVA